MKKYFTLIGAMMLLASAAQQVQAQRKLYPGLTDSTFVYQAPKTDTPPVIDGDPSDAAWQLARWKSAMRIAPSTEVLSPVVEPAGPFAGVSDCEFKYKFIWDNDRYYLLMYWKDDKVIYADKHDGYGKMPVKPAFATGLTMPALGAGDGTIYNAFRMDDISLMFINYYEPFTTGATAFNRGNNGLWYHFFPAKVTHSTEPEAVLWSQANNLPTGMTAIQVTTSACTYNSVEKAYYIEFADATWATLFATVKNQFITGVAPPTIPQKNFAVNPPAVGDKFMFTGEINDADSTLNRRDYNLFISANTVSPNTSGKEAVIVELVDVVGLKDAKTTNKLDIYPNPAVGNTIKLKSVTDVQIFSLSGHKMLESKNSAEINISSLKQGVYMVKDNAGNVNKLIRE